MIVRDRLRGKRNFNTIFGFVSGGVAEVEDEKEEEESGGSSDEEAGAS